MRILLLALTLLFAAVHPAAADDAGAKVLFDQGKTLFAEGKYGEACAKLEASFKLSALSSTRGLLGACYEKVGKLASAWAAYRDSAAIADRQGNAERAQVARTKAEELRPKLAELSIDASAIASIKGAEVAIDGVVQPKEALNTPLPLDGGPHVITADGLGWKKWEATLDIADGEKHRTVVPGLVEDPGEIEAQNAAVPMSPRRKRGLIIGGVGVGVLGVGAAFGILAKIHWGSSGCEGDVCPSLAAQDKADRAATYANVATVVSAVGLIGVGVGLTILFTGKKAETVHVAPVPKQGGVALVIEGRF